MDADERLTALKKAYADIILNTAKEAAARIMVSERKALRFQHELNVSKEQALQMLLRVKQMMDSKVSEAGMTYSNEERKIELLKAQLREAEDTISEAEMTSSSQQRKIEELEAQLQEAEDIVKDLREELREVQAELERVRNSKLQNMDEHDTATQQQTCQENRLKTSQSVIFPPPESRLEPFTASDMKKSAFYQSNEVYKCYGANDFLVGNSYICKPDSSTSEENRVNNSQSILFPPPELRLESFTASDVKNSAFNQRNEAYKSYSANDFRVGNTYVSKPDLPSIILRNKGPEPYRNRRTQRIRAFEEKLMAGELSFSETIDDVNYETSGREDGEGEGICKTPADKADNMCSTEKKDVVQANISAKAGPYRRKKRKALAARYKKNKSRCLSQALKRDQASDMSCAVAYSINNNAQSGGGPSNMAPRLSADARDQATPLGCMKVSESDAEFVEAFSAENGMNKDKASIDKLLPTRQEVGSAESSGVPIYGRDVEKVDVPVVNSQTKISGTNNGIPNQLVTDRVFKYTFQRKRKKESLSSSDGNASLEESFLKKKAEQNGPLEMENSSSITESSRDSRRVAQVARQLISLSEKKWWQ